MLIDLIAGARPNFIKIASIIRAIKNNPSKILDYRLIHTGQHYDKNMSESFFNDLNIPKPDYNLNSRSGTQAEQTAKIMIEYEKILFLKRPDLCLVVGDVNSTLACSITAKKFNIKVAHVEAGIRSGDMSMPEEINRIVTDSITDFFFTTSIHANENLLKNGVGKKNIFFVGNTMIDTLKHNLNKLKQPKFWSDYNLSFKNYIVITLHRPSNVDNKKVLMSILNHIIKYSRNYAIIFPVHPRTKKNLGKINFKENNLNLVDPLGYLEFIYLLKNCKAVITDSGGISEETTVLNIPCITLRNSTERPETVLVGTNTLVGENILNIKSSLDNIFDNKIKKGKVPKLWDGNTGERIVKSLTSIFNTN